MLEELGLIYRRSVNVYQYCITVVRSTALRVILILSSKRIQRIKQHLEASIVSVAIGFIS